MDTHRLPTRQLALLPCLIFLLLAPPSVRAQSTGTPAAPAADLLGDIVAVSAGGSHACALTKGGGVKCWGNNGDGQLGDGTQNNSATPVDVVGLGSGVKSVSTGAWHTCAVAVAGEVKCWGRNDLNQLGNNLVYSSNVPMQVSTLAGTIVAVSAGVNFTCALTRAGGVKCWGQGAVGTLGNGSYYDSVTPVDVRGLTSGVKALTAGSAHVCALTTSGAVKCWGDNYHGQLGDGTFNTANAPVSVGGLHGRVTSIEAGAYHMCALLEAGDVQCWGNNGYGELGAGTTTDSATPVNAVQFGSQVATVSAGDSGTCALTKAGALKCLGWNEYGSLGDGTTTNRVVAVAVRGLGSGVAAVSTGHGFACAVLSTGGVKCWGNNEFGQLGKGATTFSALPAKIKGLQGKIVDVSAGDGHTCALTSAGGVQCWGFNNQGQLGNGATESSFMPVKTSGLQDGVKSVSAGGGYTCAVTTTGGVKCWGDNQSNQLGDGTFTYKNHSTPADVAGLTSNVTAISAGWRHACALTTSGGLKCWGENRAGQVGVAAWVNGWIPLVDVDGMASGVAAVSAGGMHTCALMQTGIVKCWGSDGLALNILSPVQMHLLGDDIQAISASGYSSYALTRSGDVKQFTLADDYGPWHVPELGSDVAAISADGLHICALDSAGGVKCWGEYTLPHLGYSAQDSNRGPVDIDLQGDRAVALDSGFDYTCAATNKGEVWCWGNNQYGQLGRDPGWAPVDVLAGAPPSP